MSSVSLTLKKNSSVTFLAIDAIGTEPEGREGGSTYVRAGESWEVERKERKDKRKEER